MPFTAEEIKNLEALLLSPQEENIKLAFAILEGKEYPNAIKILLEEYKALYNNYFKDIFSNPLLEIQQICKFINNTKNIKIDVNIQAIGLFKKIIELVNSKRIYIDISKIHRPILKKFTSLEKLILTNTTIFFTTASNFKFLAKLKNLRKLKLYNLNLPQLPESLTELLNLEYLDVSFNRKVSHADFTPISSLKNLKKLKLEYCQLKELPKELSELPLLENLNLTGNKFSQASFDILGNLKNLKKLYLANCRLSHLPINLSELTTLEELNLNGNKNFATTDFSLLAKLKNLKALNLAYCDIIQLPIILEELKNLEKLHLVDNDLSKADFSVLFKIKNLKELNIKNCKIHKLHTSLLELQKNGLHIHWNAK